MVHIKYNQSANPWTAAGFRGCHQKACLCACLWDFDSSGAQQLNSFSSAANLSMELKCHKRTSFA